MLKVQDIRETRLYQEAFEEGEKKATARAIEKLAAKKLPAEEIASLLEIRIEHVRDVLAGRTKG
jgi:predicted transposase YdaD